MDLSTENISKLVQEKLSRDTYYFHKITNCESKFEKFIPILYIYGKFGELDRTNLLDELKFILKEFDLEIFFDKYDKEKIRFVIVSNIN